METKKPIHKITSIKEWCLITIKIFDTVNPSRTLSASTILKLLQILDGTLKNYVIIDNAGHTIFEIITINDDTVDSESWITKNPYFKDLAYAYNSNGTDIIKSLHWVMRSIDIKTEFII